MTCIRVCGVANGELAIEDLATKVLTVLLIGLWVRCGTGFGEDDIVAG